MDSCLHRDHFKPYATSCWQNSGCNSWICKGISIDVDFASEPLCCLHICMWKGCNALRWYTNPELQSCIVNQDVALFADICPHIWPQDMLKLLHLACQHGGQRPHHALFQLMILQSRNISKGFIKSCMSSCFSLQVADNLQLLVYTLQVLYYIWYTRCNLNWCCGTTPLCSQLQPLQLLITHIVCKPLQLQAQRDYFQQLWLSAYMDVIDTRHYAKFHKTVPAGWLRKVD